LAKRGENLTGHPALEPLGSFLGAAEDQGVQARLIDVVCTLGPSKAIDDLAFCEVIGIDVFGNSIVWICQFQCSTDIIGVEPRLPKLIDLGTDVMGLEGEIEDRVDFTHSSLQRGWRFTTPLSGIFPPVLASRKNSSIYSSEHGGAEIAPPSWQRQADADDVQKLDAIDSIGRKVRF
jgi:hypothetical protein